MPTKSRKLLRASSDPLQRRPATKYNCAFRKNDLVMDDFDAMNKDQTALLVELQNLINWTDQYLRKSCHRAYLMTALDSARATAGKYKPTPILK